MSQMGVVKLQKLKIDLETERKELEQRVKEVEKREAQNDLERKGLLVEKEKVSILLDHYNMFAIYLEGWKPLSLYL